MASLVIRHKFTTCLLAVVEASNRMQNLFISVLRVG